MIIKKGDFVELEYIGRLQEDGKIFDLTSEELAKKEKIHNPHGRYGPRIICVGEGHIVKGIDEFLVGKSVSHHTVPLSPDQAFGKKNAKLMKIVPSSVFKKQHMKPFPGLHVNFDGYVGTIKTVSGGRVIVDFNHPLAGRGVVYDVTVKRVVTDVKEKVGSYLALLFGKDTSYSIEKGIVSLSLSLPDNAQRHLQESMKRVIPEIKDVLFEEKKKREDTAGKKATADNR